MVGAEVVHEPEWTTEDRDMVLAQFLWEQSLDPNGIPIDEATSDEADPSNYNGKFYFHVPESTINWAERARLAAIDQYKKDHENANVDGRIWTPVKTSRTVPHQR